jgi:hypothetical protein
MLAKRVVRVDVGQGVAADHPVHHRCGRLAAHQARDDFSGEPEALGGFPAGAADDVQDLHGDYFRFLWKEAV